MKTNAKINWSIFALMVIFFLAFSWAGYDNMKLERELNTRQSVMLDLMEAYHECDDREQAQNKCLYETKAIDFETCYWQSIGK